LLVADEFSRIDEILRRLRHDADYVSVTNGDDAAVLAVDGQVVLSVDAAVEGTHFRRDWLSFDQLGYRSVVTALSDLAAMGAQPRATLTSLIADTKLTDAETYALAEGCARAAWQYGAPVVGGNLSRGSELSLTTTVIGAVNGAPMQRSGARPGDHLYVTGTLGAAALGLLCLQTPQDSALAASFVQRWRHPVARIDMGLAIRDRASAAIDVSDGVLQDLRHLCRASNVGAHVHADRLPLAEGAESVAARLGVDAGQLALSGGEDYELLFTASPKTDLTEYATRIGDIIHGDGISVFQHGARVEPGSGRGFMHFD